MRIFEHRGLKFTEESLREAVKSVTTGADVLDYGLAVRLRFAQLLGLVRCVDPKGNYKPEERLPYFGAMTTRLGLEYLHGETIYTWDEWDDPMILNGDQIPEAA